MAFKKKTVIVLGAKGSLGQEFVRAYKDEANVIALDVEELDITNKKAVHAFIGAVGPDLVLNCAGMTNVDACELDKQKANEINGLAVGYIA